MNAHVLLILEGCLYMIWKIKNRKSTRFSYAERFKRCKRISLASTIFNCILFHHFMKLVSCQYCISSYQPYHLCNSVVNVEQVLALDSNWMTTDLVYLCAAYGKSDSCRGAAKAATVTPQDSLLAVVDHICQ